MNRSVSNWVRTGAGRVQRGFTLVELLVVIAIIGTLVGLLVPAVFGVVSNMNRASVKFELQALNDGVEKYRSKYGDYPPDGSSWTVMESHLRKAFPNILQSELNLLNPASPVPSTGSIRNDHDTSLALLPLAQHRVMDCAEALVFFLGGFSSDAQRPLTGPGGPFVLVGGAYGYNTQRQNSFFEFPFDRLTLAPAGNLSTDEVLFGLSICIDNPTPIPSTVADLLPVFMSKGTEIRTGSPYVYFDSRTYQVSKGTVPYFNFYQPSDLTVPFRGPLNQLDPRGSLGAARPVLSEQVNPATGKLLYENKSSFQILSPGVDGRFGGRIAKLITAPSDLILFTSKGVPCTLSGVGFVTAGGPPLILPEHVLAPESRPMKDDAGNMIERNTLGENIL